MAIPLFKLYPAKIVKLVSVEVVGFLKPAEKAVLIESYSKIMEVDLLEERMGFRGNYIYLQTNKYVQ